MRRMYPFTHFCTILYILYISQFLIYTYYGMERKLNIDLGNPTAVLAFLHIDLGYLLGFRIKVNESNYKM